MKYINATVSCYEAVMVSEGNPIAFNKPFNGIVATKRIEDGFSIGNFKIVTQLNILGTNNEENKKANIINQKGRLDVIIRFTKCDSDEEKQIGIDLDSFSIDIQEMESQIEYACYPFLNYTRITDVKGLDLAAGTGSYVIKILVKKSTDEKYTIQTMSRLKVIEP